MADYLRGTKYLSGFDGTPAFGVRNDQGQDLSTVGNSGGGTRTLAPLAFDSGNSLRVTQEGGKATYRLSQWNVVGDGSAGDIAQIQGTTTLDQQTISCNYTPTGGNITLSLVLPTALGGATLTCTVYMVSSVITAAQVQLAIENMLQAAGLPAGCCFCTGGTFPGTGIVVNFCGILNGPQTLMTLTTALTGGSPGTASIAHTTTGLVGGSVIKLQRLFITAALTAAASGLLQVVRRSTANTGAGVTTNQNVTPNDQTDPPSLVTAKYWTTHPSAMGTAVGVIHAEEVIEAALGTPAATRIVIDFMNPYGGKGITLRGTNEFISVNLPATLVGSGNLWDFVWEYTEEFYPNVATTSASAPIAVPSNA